MAEVHIVDIDGEQWDMKDAPLTMQVQALREKLCSIGSLTLGGTISIQVQTSYMGEDDTYMYFRMFCQPTQITWNNPGTSLIIVPTDTTNIKILHLHFNILQAGNSGITQMTQHSTGNNNAGMITYLGGIISSVSNFQIGIDGIVRVKK